MSKTDEVKQYYEQAGMYNGYAARAKNPEEKSKYEVAAHEAWTKGEQKRAELEKGIENEAQKEIAKYNEKAYEAAARGDRKTDNECMRKVAEIDDKQRNDISKLRSECNRTWEESTKKAMGNQQTLERGRH